MLFRFSLALSSACGSSVMDDEVTSNLSCESRNVVGLSASASGGVSTPPPFSSGGTLNIS